MGLDRNFNLSRMERLLALAGGSGARPVAVLTKLDLNPRAEAFVAGIEAIVPGARGEVAQHQQAAEAAPRHG